MRFVEIVFFPDLVKSYQILAMVMRRQLLPIPPFIQSDCANIIRLCWCEPSQRPTMTEVPFHLISKDV